jgi:hypothetical protein
MSWMMGAGFFLSCALDLAAEHFDVPDRAVAPPVPELEMDPLTSLLTFPISSSTFPGGSVLISWTRISRRRSCVQP